MNGVPTIQDERNAFKHLNALRKAEVKFSPNCTPRVVTTDGKVVVELPSYPALAQKEVVCPFKIYQPGVVSGAVAVNSSGGTYAVDDIVLLSGGVVSPGGNPTTIRVGLVDQSGNLLAAYVDTVGSYSTQPAYPCALASGSATVTVLSSADSWRVIQIGAGNIGVRPQFEIHVDPPNYPFVSPSTISTIEGPAGNELVAGLDIDGTSTSQLGYAAPSANGFVVTLPPWFADSPKQLVYGAMDDGTEVKYGQILLDDSKFADEQSVATFWIEIIDDVSRGYFVNVYGQMVSPLESIWPNDRPDIIPIGYITPSQNPQATQIYTSIQQYITTDLTNRWPNSKNGYAPTFRGWWSADSLSGQFFWPGDIVTDDSVTTNTVDYNGIGGPATAQIYKQWQYTGTPGTQTDPPHVNYSSWKGLGSVFGL
jgi:hypothetical protein